MAPLRSSYQARSLLAAGGVLVLVDDNAINSHCGFWPLERIPAVWETIQLPVGYGDLKRSCSPNWVKTQSAIHDFLLPGLPRADGASQFECRGQS